jgi:threonine dehydrogenase-like Zn-dependent dehydrogenase
MRYPKNFVRAGYHATELAGVQAGDSVVIYGAGPVGLMAAYSAIIKGASTSGLARQM